MAITEYVADHVRKKDRCTNGPHRIATGLFFVTLGLAGCSQESTPDTQAFQLRDSAGITIYENSEGEWTEEEAWRLSSEPILAIGELDGPEEYLLFQVRGARRLSNGNIVLANRGTHELRFYDPNGAHMRSVGREGDGPGEFRSMGEPWPLGSDSIAIWDSSNARFTVFDIDGALGRSFRLDPIPDTGTPRPHGIFADNLVLVSATIGREGPRPQGMGRNSMLYAGHSLEGAHVATFIRRPGTQSYSATFEGMRLIGPVPYATSPTATVFGDRWYFGAAESWEIGVYSVDGALTHLFRRDEPNRLITQRMIDEYRERSSPFPMPAASSRMQASMPIPETMPAYRSFIASDDGSLWVENYIHPSEQPSWAVFRDDGRYLGDVETPMDAQVTHIGDDFVLVIWEDELEVQQVQMYELIKP